MKYLKIFENRNTVTSKDVDTYSYKKFGDEESDVLIRKSTVVWECETENTGYSIFIAEPHIIKVITYYEVDGEEMEYITTENFEVVDKTDGEDRVIRVSPYEPSEVTIEESGKVVIEF